MEAKRTPDSPRITSLQQALASGNTAELDIFWHEMAQHGTPLIENIEGDDSYKLVTFLWRGKGDTHNVVVFAGPAGWDHPEDNQMTQLFDTDLWYRTYQVKLFYLTFSIEGNEVYIDIGFHAQEARDDRAVEHFFQAVMRWLS